MNNVSTIRELSDSEMAVIAGGEGPGGAPSTATGCYYQGQFYSPGSVVNMGGSQFRCTYSYQAAAYTWTPYS